MTRAHDRSENRCAIRVPAASPREPGCCGEVWVAAAACPNEGPRRWNRVRAREPTRSRLGAFAQRNDDHIAPAYCKIANNRQLSSWLGHVYDAVSQASGEWPYHRERHPGTSGERPLPRRSHSTRCHGVRVPVARGVIRARFEERSMFAATAGLTALPLPRSPSHDRRRAFQRVRW